MDQRKKLGQELKVVAMLMTNHDLNNTKQADASTWLWQTQLRKLFLERVVGPSTGYYFQFIQGYTSHIYISGYDWTLLDTCYLPSPLSQVAMQSWHNFFTKLGVEDFISIRQTDVTIRREQLVCNYLLFRYSVIVKHVKRRCNKAVNCCLSYIIVKASRLFNPLAALTLYNLFVLRCYKSNITRSTLILLSDWGKICRLW